MIKNTTIITLAIIAALLCLLSLAIAYFYMERYLLLEVCPLCILDRFVIAFMILFYLLIAYFWRTTITLYGWFAWWANTILFIIGFVLVGRHIWLQSQPPSENTFCLTNNDTTQGFINIIQKSFGANADCSRIAWEFVGLSIPQQLLVFFLALAIFQFILLQLARKTI